MKGKLALLTFLITAFGIYLGIKFLFLDTQNQLGKIKIISSPRTTVFVNNVASGQTPYDRDLKPGEYLVKLIPAGEATSTASWQGKVKVYRNSLSYVNRELGPTDISSAGEIFTVTRMEKKPQGDIGEISVETDPAGAIVYLDNDEKGVASMIMGDVPRGQHEISVFMPGFFRRTQKINVEKGFRVNTVFKLAIDSNQKLPDKPEEKKEATQSAEPQVKEMVTIKDTPTGFLRVRQEPSSDSQEIGRVKPGEKYELVEQERVWYKIKYDGENTGWISSEFADRGEPAPEEE